MASSVMSTFWPALERIRGLKEVPAFWQKVLSSDLEGASRYIRPTQETVRLYPCLQYGGCGFPHRVIEHAPDDIVAVSEAGDGECDELTLRREDLIVHELNLDRLGRDLAAALRLEPPTCEHGILQTRVIGSVPSDRGMLTVAFGIYADEQLLLAQAQRLRAAIPAGFITLLLPTGRLLRPVTRERLTGLGIHAVPLEGLCLMDTAGRLEAKNSLQQHLELCLPVAIAGMPYCLAPVANNKAPQEAPPPPPYRFIRKGDVWEVTFEGCSFFLRCLERVEYLRMLLERPGEELSTIDMVAEVAQLEIVPMPEDLGDMLDAGGLRALREEIRKVREKLQDAEDHSLSEEAERLRTELSALLSHWSASTAKGGKSRKAGSIGEQFRKRVGNAITRAITDIREHDKPLASHLNQAISKGTFCRYNPAPPIRWTF